MRSLPKTSLAHGGAGCKKEAKLKETFFRRLSQKVVQEIERGGNVILSDEDWDDIVQNADIIFNNFTKRLQQTYPSLNKDDLRYCCMVKMQLSQSGMAQVMLWSGICEETSETYP